MREITSHECVRLAALAVVDPRTVRRVFSGARCASTTLERIRRAADALGLPQPPAAAARVTEGA